MWYKWFYSKSHKNVPAYFDWGTKILNGAKSFANLLKSQDISYISMRTWMMDILIPKAPKYIFVREKCKDLLTGIHINLLKAFYFLVGLCRNKCVYVRSSDTNDFIQSLTRICYSTTNEILWYLTGAKNSFSKQILHQHVDMNDRNVKPRCDIYAFFFLFN